MPNRHHPYRPPRNQRLAAELYATAGQVCFVTIRAFNHLSPFTRADLAARVVDILREEREAWRCYVHVFCLMPDHLQMLTSPREDGWSVLTFVDRFKGKATNKSWEHGWRGKLWQPRGYDHLARCEQALEPMARYILSDPVRSGLVENADDYPWRGVWDPFPV